MLDAILYSKAKFVKKISTFLSSYSFNGSVEVLNYGAIVFLCILHTHLDFVLQSSNLLIVLDPISNEDVLSTNLILSLGNEPVDKAWFIFVEKVELLTANVMVEELFFELRIVFGVVFNRMLIITDVIV